MQDEPDLTVYHKLQYLVTHLSIAIYYWGESYMVSGGQWWSVDRRS